MPTVTVTTTTLEMRRRPSTPARDLPDGVRLDRAVDVSPEFARFLYGFVGGPWYWLDRLTWSRSQWLDELAGPGTEFHILYGDGQPLGYLHLQPVVGPDRTDVEIRYFGLAGQAIGRGLGGALLEHGIHAAWTIGDRFDLPAVGRVWVHTCSLDGPAALANYQARGLAVVSSVDSDETLPEAPLGSWASTGGPAGPV